MQCHSQPISGPWGRVDKIWATSWQNQQCRCAPSEDSDQPGHPQADLSLRWAHMPFCWFCFEVAQIWYSGRRPVCYVFSWRGSNKDNHFNQTKQTPQKNQWFSFWTLGRNNMRWRICHMRLYGKLKTIQSFTEHSLRRSRYNRLRHRQTPNYTPRNWDAETNFWSKTNEIVFRILLIIGIIRKTWRRTIMMTYSL